MAVITHKCPNCDAPLRFLPEKQIFHCDYCLMEYTVEEMEKIEAAQAAASAAAGVDTHEAEIPAGEAIDSTKTAQSTAPKFETDEAQPEVSAYSCPNCGAEIMVDTTTAATYCYYCHSPVVLQGRLEGAYLPDAVIPFKISHDEAVERFLAWVKKKRFVPKEFFNAEQIEKLNGVYFPFWDLDYTLDAEMDATATRIRTWDMGDMRYTETKYYDIHRDGKIQMDDIVKNALNKSNRKLVDGVQPFDQKELKPFTSAYFSGFMAERRDRELSEFEPELAREVQQYSRNLMQKSIGGGYNQITVKNFRADVDDRKEHYLLFPVWTLTYRKSDKKDDKIYYYAMNGQTGKVCGELPVSMKKLLGLFAAVALPLFALFAIVGYFI